MLLQSIRPRRKCGEDEIMKAVHAVNNGMKIRMAETKCGIPKYATNMHKKVPTTGKPGHPIHASKDGEYAGEDLLVCSVWGYPSKSMDRRPIVKSASKIHVKVDDSWQ